jgi:polyhydroxyalkanoate synthase
MTAQEHNANSFDPFFQPFVEHWATCVQQANDATKKMFGGFEGSPDPRAWRRQWFDTLSGNTDTYLRSPPFLQVMKAHIDALIQAKRRMNELQASGVRADGATASDLQTFEDRLAKLEKALHLRLSQLEQRMDAIENQPLAPIEADGWDRFLKALQIPRVKPELTMGTTPHEVVYQEGTLRLLRYCNAKVTFAEPILICFALVNRPYVLDLQGDRSVVRQLLARGFDVYLIDWGTPTDADRTLRLEDYVCGFLKNVTDFVCKHTGNLQLNLLGYCMGGTMSTMFTALYQERIRNLILMATPIDFSGDEGMLNLWARQEYFDVDKLIDAYGNCPGEFLQYCFQLMKPVQNIAEKYLTFCERLDDDSFLDNFFAMERWASDSIPVAGETFREYVKKLYQQNQLVKGEMTLGDHAVKLDAITCPLLLLVAEHDHLVPPSSTLTIKKQVSSKNVESMSINAGHIGLAVSTKAHRQLWPDAANWIADHSTART